MVKILVLCIIALSYVSSSYGKVAASRICGGRVFVDEPVVIDAPIHEDCIWQFQTKENRVLLFTLVDGNLKEAQEFFKGSQSQHSSTCNSNGFYLVALESRIEEDQLNTAWGAGYQYWTSLTDKINGNWLWEGTGNGIINGYFNWAIGQPDGSGNCMHLNAASSKGGWNDESCTAVHEAICEAQP
uniref:C-type lectin domain-containing protein n=1 Tax=Daphnia galeata TaxID=27404 RepID=A0A8J2RID6_9CRUS|nr:unnamed protein product [Daphnia galeata]